MNDSINNARDQWTASLRENLLPRVKHLVGCAYFSLFIHEPVVLQILTFMRIFSEKIGERQGEETEAEGRERPIGSETRLGRCCRRCTLWKLDLSNLVLSG